MKPKAYQSPKMEETTLQTRMHAFRKPIPCRGIDCRFEFSPKRRKQVFCSPACRLKYFDTARAIGLILLERSKDDSRLKVIVDGLLDTLKNPV